MQGMRTRNRVIALMMAMAMAIACSLAIAPAAFADLSAASGSNLRTTVLWNSNVTVTAMGGNGTYTIDSTTHTATITENTTKTENGQYIHVVMQFASTANLSGVTNENARTYLQANTTIAGRDLNGVAYSTYKRDIFNAVVDNTAKTITFDIGYNTAGTTANYNGKLYIAANSSSNSTIATAMGGNAVETLIGTGVSLIYQEGDQYTDEVNSWTVDDTMFGVPELSLNNTKATFTIGYAANNRGMVHVLILDGSTAIYNGTGTFSNGGLTIHAHDFTSQTTSDFAGLIVTAATGLTSVGNYAITSSGNTFSITNNGADVSNVRAFIYDYRYLNKISGSVGEITEPEYQNA